MNDFGHRAAKAWSEIRFKEPQMKLLDEAKKLADDIREYAPDTNIEIMIRDLIKEIERLQSEKTDAAKGEIKA